MFQKNTPKSDREEHSSRNSSSRPERFPKRSSSPKPSPETNIILSDVEIVGTARFKNDVVIDGRIDGEVCAEGSVTVGREAVVNASIRSRSVLIDGCVNGDIHATERLELTANAEVTGDISARILTMGAGAVLIGNSSVGAGTREDASGRDATQDNIRTFRQAG